jgi:hypothetical protein
MNEAACRACAAGKVSLPGSRSCTDCPAGKYLAQSGIGVTFKTGTLGSCTVIATHDLLRAC